MRSVASPLIYPDFPNFIITFSNNTLKGQFSELFDCWPILMYGPVSPNDSAFNRKYYITANWNFEQWLTRVLHIKAFYLPVTQINIF